ncbi:MAG: hypothetical protein C5B54_06735 [Acidobacteria bacterium]|nr:MAG: hypothetical protein C5B54_06735 [Acidobacteriota bacterium]
MENQRRSDGDWSRGSRTTCAKLLSCCRTNGVIADSMRAVVFALLLLIPSICNFSCKQSSDNISTHSLLSDVPEAIQSGLEKRERIFENDGHALIQRRPGSITFFVRLGLDPAFHCAPRFLERKHSDQEILLNIEAAEPEELSQSFPLTADQENVMDLKRFSGRIVSLTLSARRENSASLGGTLAWQNPRIDQRIERHSIHTEELKAFRAKHQSDNVLILLLDAASYQHFGCYGYSRNTTPNIDALAKDAILWRTAIAQCVSTRTSVGSLVTGQYPDAHGVLWDGVLADHFKTMAESFREGEYKTALFTANPYASPMFGYGQGFEKVWSPEGRVVYGDEFIQPFQQWVNSVGNNKFFGYLHFREPHFPYNPPDLYLARFFPGPSLDVPKWEETVRPSQADREKIVDAYDANLAFVDDRIGEIVNFLKSKHLWDRTIIVVMADHGEAFWQHGEQGHNTQLYDEMNRIPLLIRFPREDSLHGERDHLAAIIDLYPTFIDLFQFSRRNAFSDGQSLLPVLFSTKPSMDRMVLAETIDRHIYSLRSVRFKYIHYREKADEFFDLSTDPGERKNVLDDYPILANYYKAQLLKTMRDVRARRNVGETESKAVLSNESQEELRALGYVNK